MDVTENKRLESIEYQLQKQGETLKDIKDALIGNELGTDKGLINEFALLRDRVAKLETIKNKLIWISIGAGAALGLSLPKIWEFIQVVMLHGK